MHCAYESSSDAVKHNREQHSQNENPTLRKENPSLRHEFGLIRKNRRHYATNESSDCCIIPERGCELGQLVVH
jgi:hypothetical protein